MKPFLLLVTWIVSGQPPKAIKRLFFLPKPVTWRETLFWPMDAAYNKSTISVRSTLPKRQAMRQNYS
jgi:hypothetical protein